MQPYIADISNNSLALSACNIAKIFSKGFSLPFARANNSSGVTLYFAKAYASSFTLSSYPEAGKLKFSITSYKLLLNEDPFVDKVYLYFLYQKLS